MSTSQRLHKFLSLIVVASLLAFTPVLHAQFGGGGFGGQNHDFCDDGGDVLVEYYCNANNQSAHVDIECSKGCVFGACLK